MEGFIVIKKRRGFLPQTGLYLVAALILGIFLYKNAAAYELHLMDLRNSAGPPLSVGAAVPAFTATDLAGNLLESGSLPESYALVVSTPSCPGTEVVLEDCGRTGGFDGVSPVYTVFVNPTQRGSMERITALAARFPDFPLLLDKDNSVKWGFPATDFPIVFTIRDGVVERKQTGYVPKP